MTDLAAANAAPGNQPEWRLEYQFTKAYDVQALVEENGSGTLTPHVLDAVTRSLLYNETLYKQFAMISV